MYYCCTVVGIVHKRIIHYRYLPSSCLWTLSVPPFSRRICRAESPSVIQVVFQGQVCSPQHLNSNEAINEIWVIYDLQFTIVVRPLIYTNIN